MHETPADLDRLQRLLDRSYGSAGRHLLSIHTSDRRLSAPDLADRLSGVRVLALATATADGRPLIGAVDGLFYRGEFWFGSSSDSVRIRHIRSRPHVSATHAVGEEWAVTVHGTARITDLDDRSQAGFRRYCLEVYPDWEEWSPEAVYARVEAARMFAYAAGV